MSLPNFMCIGAAKSGTTTLYDLLRQHPNVYAPSFKEPHYFDTPSNYCNGIEWYNKTYFNSVKQQQVIMDFTPSYLYESKAAKRIFSTLGKDVKFLVILRNPVDRAYSHYLHSKRDEYESKDFLKALAEEGVRINDARLKKDYLKELRCSYVSQGCYYTMISNYLEYFPIEQFLFIHFEQEFIANRIESMQKIFSFLGIDYISEFNYTLKSNPASVAQFIWMKKLLQKPGWWRSIIKALIPSLKFRQIIKNRIQRASIRPFIPPPLNAVQREEIYQRYFIEEINKLEQLLNRKMNWKV
ncbi:sulfotransferase domain-containing protein [Flavobacteriales bacterium]|nr:sulfotransferase domain-containing protein [Flavobacteriales bacterium]